MCEPYMANRQIYYTRYESCCSEGITNRCSHPGRLVAAGRRCLGEISAVADHRRIVIITTSRLAGLS